MPCEQVFDGTIEHAMQLLDDLVRGRDEIARHSVLRCWGVGESANRLGHTSTISIVLTRLAPPRCTITSVARMRQAAPAIPASLDELENSTERGYPASDAACIKSWKKLKSDVGTAPHELLEAAPRKLAAALKPGGSPATCIFVTERFSDFRKNSNAL
jgi:hypothetical protein